MLLQLVRAIVGHSRFFFLTSLPFRTVHKIHLSALFVYRTPAKTQTYFVSSLEHFSLSLSFSYSAHLFCSLQFSSLFIDLLILNSKYLAPLQKPCCLPSVFDDGLGKIACYCFVYLIWCVCVCVVVRSNRMKPFKLNTLHATSFDQSKISGNAKMLPRIWLGMQKIMACKKLENM